jgi:hypothetical protein
MVALATGDITINKLEYGSLRKQIDMFTTVDIINVAELYDRNGNRLNPTKLDGVRDDLNVINE